MTENGKEKDKTLFDFHSCRISGLFEKPVALVSLLDQMPVGMAVLDTERRVILLNQALEALTGFSREDVSGVPCRDVIRSNLCQHDCPVLELGDSERTLIRECNIINRARERVPVRLTTIPLKGLEGNVAGYVETVQDMRMFEQMAERLKHPYAFGQIIGRSRKMEDLFRILPVIAQTDSSVLVTGETGVGKDLLAEAVHQASERSRDPFIKINCGALPETLLESELFGHKKGAFTGAVADKPGRIRLAHNGTLYLTEIGDLPLALQVKLLTFLDDKIVYPLGGTKGFQADVRVVAATHRNLERMVQDGRFREDLLFRLNVVRLHIPPLRERGEDIGLLLDHFLASFAERFGKGIRKFDEESRGFLLRYSFPGNVRELKNIVEYAANICQEDRIRIDHLPAYLFETVEEPEPKRTARVEISASLPAGNAAAEDESMPSWAAIERHMIVDALVRAKGRRRKAAEILGWGRSTLWRKMKQYGMDE